MKKILVSSVLLCIAAGAGFYIINHGNNQSLPVVPPALIDALSPSEPGAMESKTLSTENKQQNGNGKYDKSNTSHVSIAPPEGKLKVEKPNRISVWEVNDDTVLVDGIKGKEISAKENLASYLEVNQLLEFPIPNKAQTLVASVESTHNHTANVAVWKAKILDGHAYDNVAIVKGRLETHITIATEEATYIAIINNASGKGTIVDQSDVTDKQIPFDDGIPVEPVDVPPPALSYSE